MEKNYEEVHIALMADEGSNNDRLDCLLGGTLGMVLLAQSMGVPEGSGFDQPNSWRTF